MQHCRPTPAFSFTRRGVLALTSVFCWQWLCQILGLPLQHCGPLATQALARRSYGKPKPRINSKETKSKKEPSLLAFCALTWHQVQSQKNTQPWWWVLSMSSLGVYPLLPAGNGKCTTCWFWMSPDNIRQLYTCLAKAGQPWPSTAAAYELLWQPRLSYQPS